MARGISNKVLRSIFGVVLLCSCSNQQDQLAPEPLANSSENLEYLLEHDGYSRRGVEAVLSSNPYYLLTIDDFPSDMQESILASIEEERQNGYVEVDEFDANEIIEFESLIIGRDETNANLIFDVAALPEIILNNFEYPGYTHPNYSVQPAVATMQNGTLRRVFTQITSGNLLIVQQSVQSAGNGSTMLRESVNTSVAGLPARFFIARSTSGRRYATLLWNTKHHDFVLYQTADLGNAESHLVSVGEALTRVQLSE